MDCPYCGKTIEDGGFFCKTCSGQSQPAKKVDDIKSSKLPEAEAPEQKQEPTTKLALDDKVEVLEKKSIKILPKPSTTLSSIVKPENEKKLPSTSDVSIKKKLSKQIKKKAELPEIEDKHTPIEDSKPETQSPEVNEKSWKNHKKNPELKRKESALFLYLVFSLFILGMLPVFFAFLLNGIDILALFMGILIFPFVLGISLVLLEEYNIEKWRVFVSWIYDTGKRAKVAYRIEREIIDNATFLSVRILPPTDKQDTQKNVNLNAKLPMNFYLKYGLNDSFFIAKGSSTSNGEAELIYDLETIDYGCILEDKENNARIWCSTRFPRAPKN